MYVYVALLFTLIMSLPPPHPRSFFALGGGQLEYHIHFLNWLRNIAYI